MITALFLTLVVQAQESSIQQVEQEHTNIEKDKFHDRKDTLTTTGPVENDSLKVPEQINPKTLKRPSKDSVIVVKHSFKHKEQVIVGGVIMASLALILVAMNNYNPK